MDYDFFKRSIRLASWGLALTILGALCIVGAGLLFLVYAVSGGYDGNIYLAIGLVGGGVLLLFTSAVTRAFSVVVRAAELKLKESGYCLPGDE